MSASYTLAMLAILSIANLAVADEDSESEQFLRQVLVVGKTTGACGMLKQQAQFQESTQMTGGDEFLLRFISTEAARLGYSRTEYLKACTDATDRYQQMWNTYAPQIKEP